MSTAMAVQGRSGRWGVWVALALSLTLNLFVLGGLGWSAMTHPHRPLVGPARLIEIGRSLDLTAEQQTALRGFAEKARDLDGNLRQGNLPLIQQVWTEMGKPTPDMATIERLNDELLAHRRDFSAQMAQNLLAFLGTLTPDQRQRFVDSAMEPPDRRR